MRSLLTLHLRKKKDKGMEKDVLLFHATSQFAHRRG